MRIEKSAFEKKIHCQCGCVFYADSRDFSWNGGVYEVFCPQCKTTHTMLRSEYWDMFDTNRFSYGNVPIGWVKKNEVRKTGTNRK